MANTFAEKAVKFIPVLDKIYKKGSVTAFLDKANAIWVGTNKIKRPKIVVEGAGDYSRSSGYVEGDVSISYSEHTLDYDRGRKFSIDVIDDDETGFDAYRTLSTEYVRTKEVPETDAIRFAEIYAKASAGSGTVVASDTITEALALYDTAEAALIDAEVNPEDLVMWCSSAFYKALKTKLAGSGRIDWNENSNIVDRRVKYLDGMIPVMPVPKTRFYSAITLYDGTTGGQEAGGYIGTATTGYELNFILADKNVLEAYVKRNANKIISPELNQSKDAWAVYYRQHHDLIINDNSTAGIYIHRKATAL